MVERRPDAGGSEPVGGTPADATGTASRTLGWSEVLLVGALVVGVVFGIQVLTSALPPAWQDVVFRTPLAIVVLIVGTVGLLAWLARRRAV